ncbi:MAG: efflux RND transporter periplasmic adaptor subunit [Magnetococcales bacterium]|nr:efflux RND transporter periplasmic adaptor subunit [Magnetococcales bacterium]
MTKFAGLVLAGCFFFLVPMAAVKGSPPSAAPARPALTTTAVTATIEQWPVAVTTSGAIVPWQEMVIGAEIAGLRIADILVDVGAVVHRGQLLAQLAARSVEIDLAQQRAVVAQARAALAEARANAKRARHVTESGALPQQQVDQYLAAEESAVANVALAEARLDSQRLRLDQTRIVAVDEGIVVARSATLGAVVSVGSELFRMIRHGRLEWRAEVMANQLAQIQPGQKAYVRLPTGEEIEGVVRMKAPTFDVTNRRALIYVDLPLDPDQRLAKAGMFVHGTIVMGSAAAMTLPQSAVVMRDGYEFVFVIQAGDSTGSPASSQVTRRPVTVGRRMADRVEIVTGLDESAAVAASGAAFLNDGDRVRLVTGADQPAR